MCSTLRKLVLQSRNIPNYNLKLKYWNYNYSPQQFYYQKKAVFFMAAFFCINIKKLNLYENLKIVF